MNPKLLLVLALAALALLVAFQNTGVVAVRFLFWEKEMSRVLVFLFLFVAGFALGWAVPSAVRARRKRRPAGP